MESPDVLYGEFYEVKLVVLTNSPIQFLPIQLTELFSTTFVLHLADKDNPVTSRKVLCIVGTALLHIIAGSVDQFIQNVFLGEGYLHQIIRDIGFMIPDALHLGIPLLVLRKEALINRPLYRDKTIRKDVLVMFGIITLMLVFVSLL